MAVCHAALIVLRSAGLAVPVALAACLGSPSWARNATPTATPTPRPLATGDLGERAVHGQITDAAGDPIAGATVWYSHLKYLGGGGAGEAVTDGAGQFEFSLFLHDTDTVTLGVEAAGFAPRRLRFSGYQFYSAPPVDVALAAIEPETQGHRVTGALRGLFCDVTWSHQRVRLEPSGRRVVTGADGSFVFEDVADGTYQLRGPRCPAHPCFESVEVTVAGADVSVDVCQELCAQSLALDPRKIRAGEQVTVAGFCYYLHSGKSADVLLDDVVIGTLRGNTSGDYSACLTVPADTPAGPHLLLVAAFDYPPAVGALIVLPECGGDCDGDGAVGLGELVRGVAVALGALPVGACHAADVDGDGFVVVNELIAALTHVLDGCAAPD